jgi:CDP-paratose 2-epimerase
LGREINLNGKGKQVRDLLYVEDLVKLFLCVSDMPFENYGHSVNVGGGALNSLSILELFEFLEELLGTEISYKFGQERPSDQKVFISDNTLIQGLVNWRPSVSVEQGLGRLIEADGSD